MDAILSNGSGPGGGGGELSVTPIFAIKLWHVDPHPAPTRPFWLDIYIKLEDLPIESASYYYRFPVSKSEYYVNHTSQLCSIVLHDEFLTPPLQNHISASDTDKHTRHNKLPQTWPLNKHIKCLGM